MTSLSFCKYILYPHIVRPVIITFQVLSISVDSVHVLCENLKRYAGVEFSDCQVANVTHSVHSVSVNPVKNQYLMEIKNTKANKQETFIYLFSS